MSDELTEFFSKTKESIGTAGRGPAEERVEQLLDDLGLPWAREPEGDSWELRSDLGEIQMGLSEDDSVVSIWHLVHRLDRKKLKKDADYLKQLLEINSLTRGACFAIDSIADDDWVLLIARMALEGTTKESLTMAIEDILTSLKMYG